jgi:TadE-like protein
MNKGTQRSQRSVRRERYRILDDRGSSIVEAVVVVPVLMLILLVLIQLSLWAHAAQITQLAASEGDQAARAFGGGAPIGEARAYSILDGSGSDLSSSSVTVAVMPGDMARIAVTGTATSVLPGISLPVGSVQIGPIQEFRGSE